MTKQEFTGLLGSDVADAVYADIEKVYTYHPSISEVDGKRQIVALFREFGYRIVRDMLATAQKAEDMICEIQVQRMKLEEMQEEYKLFRTGFSAS